MFDYSSPNVYTTYLKLVSIRDRVFCEVFTFHSHLLHPDIDVIDSEDILEYVMTEEAPS